jgi:hypothetical protein
VCITDDVGFGISGLLLQLPMQTTAVKISEINRSIVLKFLNVKVNGTPLKLL